MKRSLALFLIGLFMAGVSGYSWAEGNGPTARDVECTECVNATDIATSAVTEPKLAAGVVTNGKIAEGAVTNSKVSDGAITETKILDGAVTNNKLADWSVSGSKIVDFSITDTKISSNAVTTAKIADGAITDAKISGTIAGSKLGTHTHTGSDIVDGTITTSKIGDGAITDAKITGPISASKLEKPANVVVVAKSGGDFISIQSAIDSINPTAENPYLIKVMPGTYEEIIIMKSYVHLQGAGKDVTTIRYPGAVVTGKYFVISLDGLTNVAISGFTIIGGSSVIAGGDYGIKNSSSSSTIADNLIIGSQMGILIAGDSSALVTENTIKGNYVGISTYTGAPNVAITGNIITANSSGLWNYGAAGTITGNIITGNGNGMLNWVGTAALFSNNRITGNSVDINSERCYGTPLFTFNVYDTMQGCGIGVYNVKSNGTTW